MFSHMGRPGPDPEIPQRRHSAGDDSLFALPSFFRKRLHQPFFRVFDFLSTFAPALSIEFIFLGIGTRLNKTALVREPRRVPCA
jgi:hypothetical protein